MYTESPSNQPLLPSRVRLGAGGRLLQRKVKDGDKRENRPCKGLKERVDHVNVLRSSVGGRDHKHTSLD